MSFSRGYLVQSPGDQTVVAMLRDPDRTLGRTYQFEAGEFRVTALDPQAGTITLRGVQPGSTPVKIDCKSFGALLSFMGEC